MLSGDCRSATIFDFIVVGAGTAGSVVASRLSEETSWNILLLEAGGNPTMTSDVPYFYMDLQRSDIDWDYQTIPEKGLYNGFMGKVNRWPSGKVLGGTSTMGSMLYIRGIARDYDNLAGHGNAGWSYDDVLPYFLKSEDMRDLERLQDPIDHIYHATGGPLILGRFSMVDPIAELIQNASTELGYSRNFDINGVTQVGFSSPNVGTVVSGERLNMIKAFINPVRQRPNLFVIKHAYAVKVLICDKTKRAYGVEFFYRNEHSTRILRASREIIVCAGTVGSAKLLMLSGVGPKNHLDELGICVQQNLEVGLNLRDNVMFPVLPITVDFGNETCTPLKQLDHSYEYLTRRTGTYASIGLNELVGMLNIDTDDAPGIYLRFMYIMLNDTLVIKDFIKNIGFVEEIVVQIMDLHNSKHLIIPMVTLLHPKSRGRIKLKSKNPDDMPYIEGRYLDNPEDLDSILWGIRFIEKLANHEYLKEYNSSMQYINYTGCVGLVPGSDYYWACAMSHVAGTGYSPVGTCKMGPCGDVSAVVDPELRVYGIKGLRVADASILPVTITGPNLATVIMIGEKAADLIKRQWISGFTPVFTTRDRPSRTTTAKEQPWKIGGDERFKVFPD